MFSPIRVSLVGFCPRLASGLTRRHFKIDKSKYPVLKEEDIEERFIGGSGPGGQNVNKSTNCCQLRHIPTGIVVKSHQSRTLGDNRRIARELLTNKLDHLYNGENSVENQLKKIAKLRAAVKEVAAEKKRLMKKRYQEEILQNKSNMNDDG